ncbi:glycoside hydrolase family 32 protein [Paenibacillus sp. N4]|uniref:glycoside hydrolase family 32 protein n=1 Tax=Paenibacillus vietnamensis TaxID=2590547 RepID=UPI001CD12145|nr:glycoside hydrolase family 32 protein [Paenibacillus vietnamensis]MCA0755990.1 glycoside hydrolase family 32 protein [Paenibacillus vietnamensis]
MKHHFDQPLRPQFHFTPASNWLNDPNGMVYYDGEYHLFYQHHPDSSVWGPMHWGHAVSTDLVHWEHFPIALYPDHNGTIFSGSAVVDWNDTSGFFDGKAGLVAIYTQTETIPGSDLSKQRQSIAYSKDNGRTWIPYEGNPVLADERFADFRDPKVFWHRESEQWIMVLAAGDRLFLYRSPDLKAWTFASEFGAQDGSHDGVWECPDLFELPVEGGEGASKWVMIVSIGDDPACPEGSRTQYFTGEFDGFAFTNDNPADTVLWLDHGRDNYAGVSWSDAPGLESERLFIGWMNNWKYANLIPTSGWRGAMTLARKLTLRQAPEGVRLVQKPVESLSQLRLAGSEWQNERIGPEASLLCGAGSGLLELEADFEPGTASEFGIKLLAGGKETVIGYDTAAGELFIDRSDSGIIDFQAEFGCRHAAQLPAKDGRIKLQLWLDRSSVEVFADEGGVVMTDQLFPHESWDGIELYAAGGEALLRSLRLYPLRSIYAPNAAEAVGRSQ